MQGFEENTITHYNTLLIIMSVPKLIFKMPNCTGFWTRWYCRRLKRNRTMKIGMTQKEAKRRLPKLCNLILKLQKEDEFWGGIPNEFDITSLDK